MRITVVVVIRAELVSLLLLRVLAGAEQRAGLLRAAHGRFVAGDRLLHRLPSEETS